MRVVLAGGGTGGHVYPGIAVARALQSRAAAEGRPLELLYIGVRGRADETIVPAEGLAFRAIDAGQLRVASPVTFARNMLKLARGVVQSTLLLRRFRPDVVFATGGYASVPVGVAARLLRRPLIVYLPDVTPGWAVRLLSRLATRMTTTSERALGHLPRRKTTVVGYPVRAAFWSTERAEARMRLGLAPDARVLLVTAGSLGAHSINDAVWTGLPGLLDHCVVLHVTGAADLAAAEEQRARLSPEQRARYLVHGYLTEMPAAMVSADLAISRSGASTLGELPAAGLPAILVPGEYEGWTQAPNAEYLRAAGAAVLIRNEELDRLTATALELLSDDARLGAMRAAVRRLARPGAADDLAQILEEVTA